MNEGLNPLCSPAEWAGAQMISLSPTPGVAAGDERVIDHVIGDNKLESLLGK